MKKLVPYSHKCQHGLWSNIHGNSLKGKVYKGCAMDHRIDDLTKETLCPLLPKYKKVKKQLT
jgi:hypothetical protein